MYLLLIYRPEADDQEGNGRHGDEPFAGIELHGMALSREAVEEQAERNAQDNPHWHFYIMPVS